MRYWYLSLFIIGVAFGPASAQNLVPNPNFEVYNACPWNLVSMPYTGGYNNFPTITSWTSPVKMTSPDFLNDCAAPFTGLQIPNTTFGYQTARSGGGFTGIIGFQGDIINGTIYHDYREYIQTRLSQPMTAGKQYCVRFYVSPTLSANFNFNNVATDELGINFSVARPVDSVNRTLSLPYHIKNKTGNYLADTAIWHMISGTYQAQGGEEWLTLGCFDNTPVPGFINTYPAQADPNKLYWTYLFIEDVSVIEIESADTMLRSHDTLVCKSSGLNLVLEGVNNAASYIWQNGATSSQITIPDTGVYWCMSKLDCGVVVDTFRVYYQQFKPLELGQDTTNCLAQPVTIGSPYTYANYMWNTGAVTPSLTVNQSGSYILTVTDTCGSQTDTVNVAIQAPTPPPVVRDTMVCQFAPSPVLSVNGINLTWYFPNANIGSPTQPYIFTAAPGDHQLYVSQTVGKCESRKVPINIKVKYKPEAEIGDYHVFCNGADSLIGQGYTDVEYLWNTGERSCCIRPRQTGTYEVRISNECGVATDTAFVEFFPCDDCLFIPTAFTPNRDGRNDAFLPLMKCPVYNYHLSIFNRWGEIVFDTNSPVAGWDGSFKGANADVGVYVYVMEYNSANTRVYRSLKGNITLIR